MLILQFKPSLFKPSNILHTESLYVREIPIQLHGNGASQSQKNFINLYDIPRLKT